MTAYYTHFIKSLSSVCLLLLSFILHAQYENVWAFGRHAGLDFNSGLPLPVQTSTEGFGEANASVCGSNGELLFYTEGTVVWDKHGNIMANGDNLLPLVASGNNTPTSSTSQGALIMPVPGTPGKYYVFSLTSYEAAPSGHLYYSVIDMGLNNGLGEVVASQKGILLDSNLTEQMTSVAGGRCNVWLLLRSKSGNTFKAYSISESGINTSPQESHMGALYSSTYTGQMAVSPDGKKLVTSNGSVLFLLPGGVELFDFNISTGIVSNARVLDKLSGYYGAAFSPDNSKLYASTQSSVYQFDLTAQEPAGTKTLIGASSFSHLKLAPDGKIYFRSSGSRNTLSAINLPALAGQACQFVPDAVTLLPGTSAAAGLPNVVSVVFQDTAAAAITSLQAPCWISSSEGYNLAVDPNGWDYQWSTGASGSSLSADAPGIYWVSYYTAPCVAHTDTFHLTFPNGVLPTIDTRAACKNDQNGKAFAYTYTGDTVQYAYLWQNSSGDMLSLTDTLHRVSSGNYTLRIRTVNCDTTLSFFIPEEDHKVSFLADSIACQDTELKFQNTSDTGFARFQWDFGDQGYSILDNPTHRYVRPGHYTITLTGTGTICKDTFSKPIVVDSMFSGKFLMQPDSICIGEKIVFIHPETDSSATGMHWQFGDGLEMMADHQEETRHAYEKAGMMPVHFNVHFRACPTTSYADTAYVFQPPKVDLGPDRGLCPNGQPIILKNMHAVAGGGHHHLWSTSDTAEALKVKHPGIYSLTVSSDPLGCSTTEAIEIIKNCHLNIPNAFTPDGDGANDYFFPRQLLSKNVTAFKMQVFSRWGQVVFETSNIDGRGWDGQFNGKDQPAGVYLYIIAVEMEGERSEKYEGNVTLIR